MAELSGCEVDPRGPGVRPAAEKILCGWHETERDDDHDGRCGWCGKAKVAA